MFRSSDSHLPTPYLHTQDCRDILRHNMESSKGTRLDKLLHLVEGGENSNIRDTAARQIANLAKSHPTQTSAILRKVHKILYCKRWEGRVAAGTCLSLLAEQSQHRNPSDLAPGSGSLLPPETLEKVCEKDKEGYLRFSTFNVANLLRDGQVLLQSGGQEFLEDDQHLSSAERLQKQRKALKERLKLTPQLEGIVNTHELVEDEDLVVDVASERARKEKKGQSADEVLSQMSGLSARERNQLKRKLKQAGNAASGSKKRQKQTAPAAKESQENPPAEEEDLQAQDSGQWLFQHVADQMLVDCLNSSWEVRHGAALGLREILSFQACSAAVVVPTPDPPGTQPQASGDPDAAQKAQVSNAIWIEDCIVHLLTVLALDRFGDYGSDQVVAPVRETAAQALGAASRALSGPKVTQVVELLCKLAEVADWSVRHGGLLGLKYIFAARHDLVRDLIQSAVPAALRGLQDAEDDVRAVAADALLPVAPELVKRNSDVAATIERILWDILPDTSGDLNLSTGSVMRLMACLFANGYTSQTDRLPALLPRLWPYFRHTLSTVRLTAVQCLSSLLALAEGPVLWMTPSVFASILQLAFQNFLLEADSEIVRVSQDVWRESLRKAPASVLEDCKIAQSVAIFFSLAGTVEGHTFDQEKLAAISASGCKSATDQQRQANKVGEGPDAASMRFTAAKALGQLGAFWRSGSVCPVASGITAQLESRSAAGRQLAALTAMYWALELRSATSDQQQQSSALPTAVLEAIQKALQQPKGDRTTEGHLVKYTELDPTYQQTHNTATRLLKLCIAKGQDMSKILSGLPPQQYTAMLTAENAKELAAMVNDSGNLEVAESRKILLAAVDTLVNAENLLHISVTAMMAAAIVQAGHLPAKLNGVIQPLMAALRRNTSPLLRPAAASALAELTLKCIKQSQNLVAKVVGNVASLVCSDPAETPKAADPDPAEDHGDEIRGKGRGKSKVSSTPKEADENAVSLANARQGGEAALKAIAQKFGANLLSDLPTLANKINSGLSKNQTATAAETQTVLDALQLLRVIGPSIAAALPDQLLAWLQQVLQWLPHDRSIVRTLACKTAAAIAASNPDLFLPVILRISVPMLSSSESNLGRQGAVELVKRLVHELKEVLVPYLLLFVMPIMSCMADQNSGTRIAATSAFGRIVSLLPLAQGLDPPGSLSPEQRRIWLQDAEFLQELLDNSKVRPAEVPAEISADLRPYQQEGINWLAFLRRCGLHGILADDMGLGKTLQATATLTASHLDSRRKGHAPRPSIVICPQVLVGHWSFEIGKFVRAETLRPIAYEGSPQQRESIRAQLKTDEVVIMSYETLRADIDWVQKRTWKYCILDEGHIIRNPKSKITEAVKKVVAEHRLILSGTPIQNNVNELWALFNFLMPGFLGRETEFNAKFGKAFRAARSSKIGSKEAQAAFIAMEGLHKQVMPFILRRHKDAVLKELPPKIIQDVYCDMSPLQSDLYNQFCESAACQSVHGMLAARASGQQGGESETKETPHVFQALQYMRKLCSHPLMVLQPSLQSHVAAALNATGAGSWEQAEVSLHDTAHAPKLAALIQLLQQCSIIDKEAESEPSGMGMDEGEPAHRVLVFAQFKLMLDLVERDVLQPNGVPFLRLDGSVEASRRFNVVRQFNNDPSIPVMLLTTSVGGLGLNLTAADTVIFLEHDWNPMKDLQAMDRAHRLGQSRTVNVYRLLMKNSMEDRVMSLQQFKTDVANTVINQENVSLTKMDTSKLLEIWQQPDSSSGRQTQQASSASDSMLGAPKGLKSMLEGLEDLWDQSQYVEEFSLDSFVKKLS